MKVLRFTHGGLCCALPPAQVRRGAGKPEGPIAQLFAGSPGGDPPETYLEVRLADDDVWIGVRDLLLVEIEHPTELSPVASGIVREPHVVGWAEDDERFVWLVDLNRYRAATHAR